MGFLKAMEETYNLKLAIYLMLPVELPKAVHFLKLTIYLMLLVEFPKAMEEVHQLNLPIVNTSTLLILPAGFLKAMEGQQLSLPLQVLHQDKQLLSWTFPLLLQPMGFLR